LNIAGVRKSDALRAFGYAVLLHLVLIGLLAVSIRFPVHLGAAHKGPAPEVVHAVAVDEKRVAEELDRIKAREEEKARAEREQEARVKKLLAEAEQAERARKAEEQRLKEVAEKRKQAEAEAKKLAEKRAAEEAAEKRRKAEAKKLAEKRAADEAAEKKRKAAAEAERKKAEAAQRRKEEEEALRAAMEEEQRQQRAASALSEYAPIIQGRVSRYWVRPPGADEGLKCRLLVHLTPGGEVVDVKIVRSSGNAAFDRSVQNAVFKATPLPLPGDPELARYFRDIEFIFDPSRG